MADRFVLSLKIGGAEDAAAKMLKADDQGAKNRRAAKVDDHQNHQTGRWRR